MTTPQKSLPPLPKTVTTPAGPWYGHRVPIDHDGKGETYGLCDWPSRTIRIRPNLRRTAAWLTLEHEWVHAVLYDAGVDGLSEKVEEAVCNALALALVHRRR